MIRTGYSFHVAFGHLPEVLSRLKEIGWKHAPIADVMSTFGFRRWRDLCVKEDMTPIYGVELAVSPDPNAKKPIHDRWVFLAKESVRPLHELVSKATLRPDPALTYKEACGAKGVFKITGPFCQLKEMVAGPDIYFGLSPATPKQLYEEAYKLGHQFCAMSQNVCPRESDFEAYRATLGWRADKQTYAQHILSDDEWRHETEWFAPHVQQEAALIHRDWILSQCKADLVHGEFLHPEMNVTLEEMCLVGAAQRGINLGDPVYLERMKRELEVIHEKDFEDYFFIVADMIQHAKQMMLVGPGRGSSAGSLVCYLLGITDIDPIVHGTMFERFIDITRSDYPDIDSDFSDEHRELVFKYMADKYGSDHVARLGTVGMMQPKSVFNDISKSLRIPKWATDNVVKMIEKRAAGDERAHLQVEDIFTQTDVGRNFIREFPHAKVATRMENHPSNASKHAAGLLLTQNPIIDVVAVDLRTNGAMLDMKDAEDFKLLKIDVLGLTQLSVFERCLGLLGKKNVADQYKFLNGIPLDDQNAYQVLRDYKFSGIFQFTGKTLAGMTRLIEVDNFNDLVVLTSIARPGVTEADEWIRRRNGANDYDVHPALKEITKETLGIVVYQEQVLRIAREVGGLSWADANKMRKAIAKSMGGEALAKFETSFVEGAKANGLSEADGRDIWAKLCRMGSYAFNKSHAVAYSIVSYYCAYLKAHHPLEFAAATLDAESDPMRQIAILRELESEGVGYVSFHKDLSSERWTVAENRLIGPITNVKGIGPAGMQEILDYRADPENKPLRKSLEQKIEQVITPIDSLYPVADALTRLPDLIDLNIVSVPTNIEVPKNEPDARGEFLVVGVVTIIKKVDMNAPDKVKQRGYLKKGPTDSLNITIRDDTEEIMCKINCGVDMAQWGPAFLKKAVPKKSIYAVKGRLTIMPTGYRYISVSNIRYIGDMTECSEQSKVE